MKNCALPAKLPSLPGTGEFLLCSLLRSIYLYLNVKFTAESWWVLVWWAHRTLKRLLMGEMLSTVCWTLKVVQVDLLRDSGHFKICQILIATSRKPCFGIFEINNEMHILRIQRLLIPTNLAVCFNPFLLHQIGSSGIVVFAIIRVISTLLADPKKTKFLDVSLWKPHLGSVDPSNSFFVATVFRFLINVSSAKWNYPGIFGRMNLFNIYIHNGTGLVT